MVRRKKRTGKIQVRSHGKKFPTDPRLRLDKLILALNTEPKQLLTLACADKDTWRSGSDLLHEWNNLEVNWTPRTTTLNNYCIHSLMPNGLARGQSILFDGTKELVKRFKLSNEGHHYGRFAAALMLNYCVENQKSLYEIFGSSSSNNDSCAPLTRLQILELRALGITSTKQLISGLNLNIRSIWSNRLALRSSGIIKYEPKVGGKAPIVEITSSGKSFLENLISPLIQLCTGSVEDITKSTYTKFQDRPTLRKYAKEATRLYQNVSKRIK